MTANHERAVCVLAIAEFRAWKARNANREAFRKFVRAYLREAGEPFDRDECEPEDGATFDRLSADKKTTQHALALARNATRRAVAKLRHL